MFLSNALERQCSYFREAARTKQTDQIIQTNGSLRRGCFPLYSIGSQYTNQSLKYTSFKRNRESKLKRSAVAAN